jgi:predicted RNA-binding protein YlxR (DUF448 family)
MLRERTCVATGETLPETQLVRFVLGPDRVLTPDVAAKLPGRGVWVRADRESLALAIKRGGFSRGLKSKIEAPPELVELTETLLARRCLDLLGLAKKAGALAVGGVQVEDAIRRAPPLYLIEGSDGAAEGRERLVRLAFGLWGGEPPLTGCFASAELGVALGRAPVVHAALLGESMAQRWAVETGRLAGFRAIIPASWR